VREQHTGGKKRRGEKATEPIRSSFSGREAESKGRLGKLSNAEDQGRVFAQGKDAVGACPQAKAPTQ